MDWQIQGLPKINSTLSFWAKRRISDHFWFRTKSNSQRCFASLNMTLQLICAG